MRLLSYDDLVARGIILNKSSIWRLIKKGRFPQPVRVGNRNVWPESDIDQYIKGLIAARDARGAA